MHDEITYGQQASGRGRPRLIVADDDAFICSMVQSQLEYQFDCVGTASDTQSAIALAEAQRPDIAVLDVVMPGGGALHATRAIRACSPETAIVILSGDELRSEVIALLTAGATAYLRKGLNQHELACGLTAAIAAHRGATLAMSPPTP